MGCGSPQDRIQALGTFRISEELRARVRGPYFQTYGPRTRREFLRLLARNGGAPG